MPVLGRKIGVLGRGQGHQRSASTLVILPQRGKGPFTLSTQGVTLISADREMHPINFLIFNFSFMDSFIVQRDEKILHPFHTDE